MGRTRVLVLALMVSVAAVHCGNGNVTPADGATDARADQAIANDVLAGDTSQRCTSDLDCSDHVFCNGVELCMPGAAGANAQGCIPPSIPSPCRADQVCNEAGQRCTTQCAVEGDADGDGVLSAECGGGDCDDHDRNRFPGNREYCDPMALDHDEDCDAETYGVRDHDMDGAGSSACCNVSLDGTRHCGTDCDDSNASAHPGLSETCDGIDNNCDGTVDEGVREMLWPDVDGDLFGDSRATPMTGCPSLVPGTVTNGTDCDDAVASVHPGAAESCNSVDDNCNAMTDEGTRADCYVDGDGDGYAATGATVMNVCAAGSGCPMGFTSRAPVDAATTDCADTTPSRSPAVVETCNSIDDDCNGAVDDNVPSTCYRDVDGDGYAPMGAATVMGSCGVCAAGYTNRAPRDSLSSDCRDDDASINPGRTEVCNGIDDNCTIDGHREPAEDVDSDGYAPPSAPCTGGSLPKTDCNDSDANVHPGQTSYFTLPRSDRSVGAPDAYDYDCNGTSDIQYPTVTRCYSFGGSCSCMTASLGWSTPTPPPCGMTQQTADCLVCDSGCNPHTAGNTQTQGCR